MKAFPSPPLPSCLLLLSPSLPSPPLPSSFSLSFLPFTFSFKTESLYVGPRVLELAMWASLASNSPTSAKSIILDD